MLQRLIRAAKLVRFRDLAISRERCALCSFPLIVKLAASEMGVRCPRCGASAVSQSLVQVLVDVHQHLDRAEAYELSSTGPLVDFLKPRVAKLTTSEWFDDVEPGEFARGTQCQDVQRLTFDSESFDLCTSTEVFEHVEDDAAGFSEICRVLRPGGRFVFTVPLSSQPTMERTSVVGGQRIRTLPPEFHADKIRGNAVFVYRDYGPDIVDRVRAAGFASAEVRQPASALFGFARPVIVAVK